MKPIYHKLPEALDKRRKIQTTQYTHIRQLYINGMNFSEIGRLFDVWPSTIRCIVLPKEREIRYEKARKLLSYYRTLPTYHDKFDEAQRKSQNRRYKISEAFRNYRREMKVMYKNKKLI